MSSNLLSLKPINNKQTNFLNKLLKKTTIHSNINYNVESIKQNKTTITNTDKREFFKDYYQISSDSNLKIYLNNAIPTGTEVIINNNNKPIDGKYYEVKTNFIKIKTNYLKKVKKNNNVISQYDNEFYIKFKLRFIIGNFPLNINFIMKKNLVNKNKNKDTEISKPQIRVIKESLESKQFELKERILKNLQETIKKSVPEEKLIGPYSIKIYKSYGTKSINEEEIIGIIDECVGKLREESKEIDFYLAEENFKIYRNIEYIILTFYIKYQQNLEIDKILNINSIPNIKTLNDQKLELIEEINDTIEQMKKAGNNISSNTFFKKYNANDSYVKELKRRYPSIDVENIIKERIEEFKKQFQIQSNMNQLEKTLNDLITQILAENNSGNLTEEHQKQLSIIKSRYPNININKNKKFKNQLEQRILNQGMPLGM